MPRHEDRPLRRVSDTLPTMFEYMWNLVNDPTEDEEVEDEDPPPSAPRPFSSRRGPNSLCRSFLDLTEHLAHDFLVALLSPHDVRPRNTVEGDDHSGWACIALGIVPARDLEGQPSGIDTA